MNHRFSSYAQRVGFNLTLTKNQIHVLTCIVANIAFEKINGRQRTIDGTQWSYDYPSHMCTATRKLGSIGLVNWEDPGDMKPRWCRYPWTLTKAGEMVWELLLEAGMVRKPVIPVMKEEYRRTAG